MLHTYGCIALLITHAFHHDAITLIYNRPQASRTMQQQIKALLNIASLSLYKDLRRRLTYIMRIRTSFNRNPSVST